MALKELKKKVQENNEPGFGAVMLVSSAVKGNDDQEVVVEGEILTNSVFGRPGDKVSLQGDAKAVTNLVNGGARFSTPHASAGTMLLLERARITGFTPDGVRKIACQYLTTISSPSKNYDLGRGFRETMASAPVISFPNVAPGTGEPKIITWSTNTDGITRRTKEGDQWKSVTLDLDWIREKYAMALAAGKKVKVYVDTCDPSSAIPVSSADDVASSFRALAAQSSHSIALMRAFDETGFMLTRKIPIQSSKVGDEWVPNPDKTNEYYQANEYFRGVSNDELFDDVAAGGSRMEIIPGERLYYPGDSAAFVIKKSLTDPPTNAKGEAFNIMSFTFGAKANNVAPVIIAGIVPDGGGMVPLNMVRVEAGAVNFKELITPNLSNATRDHIENLTQDDMTGEDDDEEFGADLPGETDTRRSTSSQSFGM